MWYSSSILVRLMPSRSHSSSINIINNVLFRARAGYVRMADHRNRPPSSTGNVNVHGGDEDRFSRALYLYVRACTSYDMNTYTININIACNTYENSATPAAARPQPIRGSNACSINGWLTHCPAGDSPREGERETTTNRTGTAAAVPVVLQQY